MKNKIIIFFCLFFIISGCGYNSIYTLDKNYTFEIVDLKITGDQKINSRIKKNLENISNPKSLDKYYLEINSVKQISTATKDSKGNAKIYNMHVVVKTKVFIDEKLKGEKIFDEKFNYSNNSNKFDLKQYEKNILNNLNDKIIDNIIIYLLSL
jgi:long-subunit acyl-CoA synthetase (AMP-forming)